MSPVFLSFDTLTYSSDICVRSFVYVIFEIFDVIIPCSRTKPYSTAAKTKEEKKTHTQRTKRPFTFLTTSLNLLLYYKFINHYLHSLSFLPLSQPAYARTHKTQDKDSYMCRLNPIRPAQTIEIFGRKNRSVRAPVYAFALPLRVSIRYYYYFSMLIPSKCIYFWERANRTKRKKEKKEIEYSLGCLERRK